MLFRSELSKIFNRLGINTQDVLAAAATKWNFLKFQPGLVGGHCIGVDPYYLAQKAQEVGYHPEIILAGRRMNDGMGEYVASQVVKCMIRKGITIKDAKILILGFTFKENCPDVRNTKVVDVITALTEYGTNIKIYDPWANPDEVMHEYGFTSHNQELIGKFDAIVLAVAHAQFRNFDLESVKSSEFSVVYDVKSFLPQHLVDGVL